MGEGIVHSPNVVTLKSFLLSITYLLSRNNTSSHLKDNPFLCKFKFYIENSADNN